MPLIPTTNHLTVVAAGTAHEFTKIAVGSGNRAVPADITTGWAVTALLTPFNPVREIADPSGGATGNTHAVDWQDGSEGDAVGYIVNEIGLFATPTGGAEYLAFYESVDAGRVFAKTAGSVILRRLRLQATGAQLTNATFNVTLSAPQGTEDIPGVLELATQPEVNAETDDQRAVTPLKLAGWFSQVMTAVGNIPALPISKITGLGSALLLKANINSPTLTGTARATSPAGSDDSTRIATTAQVQDAIDRRTLVITTDPTQAQINALPDGGIILVRDTTAYVP